jgi:hypothetical protein
MVARMVARMGDLAHETVQVPGNNRYDCDQLSRPGKQLGL